MKEIKEYEATIVKNGTSYQILVPAHIRKYEDLEKGDKLVVKLFKMNELSEISPRFLHNFANLPTV